MLPHQGLVKYSGPLLEQYTELILESSSMPVVVLFDRKTLTKTCKIDTHIFHFQLFSSHVLHTFLMGIVTIIS